MEKQCNGLGKKEQKKNPPQQRPESIAHHIALRCQPVNAQMWQYVCIEESILVHFPVAVTG